MKLTKYINAHHVVDLSATTKDGAIRELCSLVSDSVMVEDCDRLYVDIQSRERVMSTGIGMGLAIPHAKSSAVRGFVIAVGRCRQSIDFESLDGLPVDIIILLSAPERKKNEFLKLMAAIGNLFSRPEFKERILNAQSMEEIFRLFDDDVV